MTNAPHTRRWFQFRLRTLLIVVLVLSLPLSWFAVRLQRARRQKEAAEAILQEGWGLAVYDWQAKGAAAPPYPAWLRGPLGDDFFCKVKMVFFMSPGVKKLQKALPNCKIEY